MKPKRKIVGYYADKNQRVIKTQYPLKVDEDLTASIREAATVLKESEDTIIKIIEDVRKTHKNWLQDRREKEMK